MEIKLGTPQGFGSWMKLAEGGAKDSFPGLETQEALEAHWKTVQEFMQRESAVCAKEDE